MSKNLCQDLTASYGGVTSLQSAPCETFLNDWVGPVAYKEGNIRKPTMKKGYICVYVCFIIKDVHLDLVADRPSLVL